MIVPALRVFAAMCVPAAVVACAVPNPLACAPGTGRPAVLVTLYFGEAVPGGGRITEPEWRAFLAGTVTSNLPKGYTTADAYGAWMNPATGQIAREATKVLTVALPDTAEARAAIGRVRDGYKQAFHQQSVGMTVSSTCADF